MAAHLCLMIVISNAMFLPCTGQRQTWKKMSFIRARCAVEIALDAGVRKLQRDLAGAAVRSGASGGLFVFSSVSLLRVCLYCNALLPVIASRACFSCL